MLISIRDSHASGGTAARRSRDRVASAEWTGHARRCTLIDVETRPNGNNLGLLALAFLVIAGRWRQLFRLFCPLKPPSLPPLPRSNLLPNPPGPPRNPEFFPLDQVRPGMTATAWTIFQGTTPEPMQVEILGMLRGARGPGQDLILAKLHGAKPEYTGVVAGMSGSPVYIDGKLVGALSYRIGQFTKEPIAGITPIEQMIEVRDLSSHAFVCRISTTIRLPHPSRDARGEGAGKGGNPLTAK